MEARHAEQVTVDSIWPAATRMSPSTRRFTISVDEPPFWAAPMLSPTRWRSSWRAGRLRDAGIATNADLFGVPIDAMSIELEADVDARGMLGHDKACATA